MTAPGNRHLVAGSCEARAARDAAGVYDASERLEKPMFALIACGASAIVHGFFVIAFAAAWLLPKPLEEEQRRASTPPPPPPVLIDTELDGSNANTADDVEPGKENLAQGEPAATAPLPQQPEAAKPVEAPPKPEPVIRKAEKLAIKRAVPVYTEAEGTDRVAVGRSPSVEPSANLGGDPERAGGVPQGAPAGIEPPVPAAAGEGGGFQRKAAPNLAARFTKELPRWAADVPGWRELQAGASIKGEVVLTLDEQGKVVVAPKPEREKTEAIADAALQDSVQRTERSLVTQLSLPGYSVGSGTLALSIRAVVSDGPTREAGEEIELAFTYDATKQEGQGIFSLRTGRTVTFSVSVKKIEAIGAVKNDGP